MSKNRRTQSKKSTASFKRSAVSLGVALASASLSTPAFAQIEEITVTATRRAESVQDIPVNISAVGGGQIEQQGFDDLSEMASYVPGLNVVDQGGRDGNRIVVRGLNAEPVQNSFGQENGGGTVATYIGEIPLYVDLRLNDLERVEVLLGPQGTLYGAGTMGGAIRYIPRKPDFDGTTFDARVDAYSYSEGDGMSSDIGFTFNAPISDQFAFRGSVDVLNDEGFVDYPFVVQQPGVSEPDPDFTSEAERSANFNPVEDANFEDSVSGRLALRWMPSDTIDATLSYYFQQSEYGGRSVSGQRGTVPAGKYEAPYRVLEPNERDSDLLALEITADLGFAELTSATGLGGVEENGQRDQTDLLITLDYSYELFPTFTAFTFEDEETETFNQEFRLVSTSDGPWNWIVGAFYNRNEYDALSSEFTPGYGADAGFRTDLNDLEYFEADRTKLTEKALFGEVGYDISDQWSITLGLRLYDYEFDEANQTVFPYFEDPTIADPFVPYPLSEIRSQLSLNPNQEKDGDLFKINTSYTFDNGNLVYFTFSQGYRVGANNGGDPCDDIFVAGNQGLCLYVPGQEFGPNPGDIAEINEREYIPDTVNNFEIGAKTTLLDGNLTLNGSVFFIDWDTPQVSTVSINASTNITVNAGAAETRGIDLAANWAVSDNFDMRGSFSYTKAELTAGVPSLITTIAPDPMTGLGFDTAFEDGESGDRLPGSPETQYSLFGSYKHEMAGGNMIVVDGGYAWQGDILSLAGARGESLTLDSFGRASLSVGYITESWSVTGYADNLFDDYSESGVGRSSLFNQMASGANVRTHRTNILPPRSLGVRFKYTYE